MALGQVFRRIQSRGRGTVHVPTDFLDLGTRAAVDQALARLARRGEIRRLARGVYDYPNVHPRLGDLTPPLHQVADAIARSTGSRIQISGAQAANQLGLSSQVPAKSEYLTDGTTRVVRIGRQAIEFRHAAPRTLVGSGTAAGVVFQALRHVGRDHITSDVISRIREALAEDDLDVVSAHSNQAPAWMQPVLRQITGRT